MQAVTKFVGGSIWDKSLDLIVRALPHGKSASEQVFPPGCEGQDAAAPIGGVLRDFDQAATLEWLQCSG